MYFQRNYEITICNLLEEIYNSGLELQVWSLEFIISFSKLYIFFGFGSEIWIIHFGIMQSNLVQSDEFSGYMFRTVKSKNLIIWKHLLLKIKFLLL